MLGGLQRLHTTASASPVSVSLRGTMPNALVCGTTCTTSTRGGTCNTGHVAVTKHVSAQLPAWW